MNRRAVHWTPIGLRSLREAHEYVSTLWNVDTVEAFLSNIDQAIHHVSDFPEIAPLVPKTNFRKFVLHKNIISILPEHG